MADREHLLGAERGAHADRVVPGPERAAVTPLGDAELWRERLVVDLELQEREVQRRLGGDQPADGVLLVGGLDVDQVGERTVRLAQRVQAGQELAVGGDREAAADADLVVAGVEVLAGLGDPAAAFALVVEVGRGRRRGGASLFARLGLR